MALPELLSAPGFRVVTRAAAALPPQGLLDGVAAEMVEQARWWEHHIVEVIAGVPPEAGRAARPRPEYDPAVRSLRQRELAKVNELAGHGHTVALSTFQRFRLAYEKHGVWGLVDHRSTRKAGARTDERVLAAIDRAVAEQTNQSTGTVTRLRRRVEQLLVEEHGVDPASVMPARATFYRLVERIAAGKHTFGSARTRRSLAQRPDGPFGTVTAVRPGEWTQIDSTPLDVRVVLDNGVVDRVELSWIVDVATRSVPAAVLRPTTKAVDAALLLARAMTPEPMRPGWSDALRMSRSVLPHRRLTDIDQRLEHAAARPVIVPETIVCDHGMVYMSQAFRNACRAMGINLQPSHEGSPWEKGTVETSFSAVGTLFAQYVAGYVGSSVERRGRGAEDGAVWSMVELQQLLDEWLVSTWQNRPHDGLRHPLIPGKALTPNEMYAALVETAGYVPVPLAADDYIELLPAVWRTINAYGVKIRHRTYDCAALTPHRRQHSGVNARKGLWEVHYDPYDVTRIWVRNHHDGGWIQAPWTHLRAGPTPFGEQAWDHARQMLARRGEDPVTEAEIASAAAALLDSAERGPAREKPTKKDKRVAGRTRAVSAAERTLPSPVPGPPPRWGDDEDNDDNDEDSGQMADVIPLGVFDAREEAKKWW
ncbi:Mu transposase C-terminal domain-containing protein [Rhodococcus opacus]|uniref:Mu transposase C-terminal domain-containing protein n=1 Tax=Rhodococcus opacus TaxID=37919 RepID=UPI0029C2D8A4|nr:Mu transposase C-terminal domain-containing protein [Rhodococcus opacus]MDX5962014.1 Mu transposase C-terminal domain-containing protein [Rhodococcus opacus]